MEEQGNRGSARACRTPLPSLLALSRALRSRAPALARSTYNLLMLPVLLRLGPVTLYTDAVLLNLGVVIGLVALYLRAPAALRARWVDAGLAALVAGLFAGRLGYVFVHAGYYAGQPGEALAVWLGGLSWSSAAAGAVLGLLGYARWRRLPVGPLLDALALPLAVFGLLAWTGCWASSCAYGVEVDPAAFPAGMASTAPDLYGLTTARWPTQLAGIVWSLVALLSVWAARRSAWGNGALGWFALAQVALGAFILGFMRGDPAPTVSGIRLDVIGSALVLVAASGAWMLRVSRSTRPAAPQP